MNYYKRSKLVMEEEMRYNCQVALPDFGIKAQKHLQKAKVLVVGMGGLGCPAAQYLAATGIGTLGIADNDIISISNLHRQILYNEEEVGQKKVAVAAKKLLKQNPHIEIVKHDVWVNAANVIELINSYDIVLDTTDNFKTHYLLNDACVLAGKPMIHASVYQYEGHIAVWNVDNEDGSRSPNYRDIFPEVNEMAIPDCTDGGVLPTIVGIIGCMQANEAIKLLTGIGEVLKGRMLIMNAQTMHTSFINIGSRTKTCIMNLSKVVSIPTISREELDKERDACIVDVRTGKEHANSNIGGVNIPLESIEVRWDEIDSNKKIVFYCSSGKRSVLAAQWLKEKMPDATIYSLRDGVGN